MIKVKNIIGAVINGGKLFSVVIAILRELIQAIEVPGHGKEKKKAVKDVVREFWIAVDDNYGFPLPDWKLVDPVAGTAIDLFVKIYNLAGKLSSKEG